MQHDYVQKKKIVLTFKPTLRVVGVCKLHGALCSIPFYFDMQHDYFQKKMVLTLYKDRICACMLLFLGLHLI